MTESSSPTTRTWAEILAANPRHSANYAARWVTLRAQGKDLDGEARLIDAMAPRGAAILDAGCGTGRVGGYLLERGHRVSGVDIDPYLIDVARRDHPRGTWLVGDLARADYSQLPEAGQFDLIVAAGNVLGFVAVDDRAAVLANLAGQLGESGRLVIGFGAGRGYSFEEFFATATAAGLSVSQCFSTWELHPFTADAGFLVAVLTRQHIEL